MEVEKIIINLGWFVIRQKKRSSRPQVTVKTSVRVSAYMVEEKGIKNRK